MRKPMVTRTMPVSKVTALVVDLNTKQTAEKELTISGKYSGEKLDKAVKAVVDDQNTKFVSVLSVETNDILYGMDEQKFIDNAEVITRKSDSQN